MRILYIEDDTTNLALIERIAHSGKHQVLNYDTAEDALANIQQNAPDLVLIDLVLAGDMHGLDMVRAMRSGGFDKPIVAISAFSNQEECLEAGCDYYFVKPVPVNRMWELIEHFAAQVG